MLQPASGETGLLLLGALSGDCPDQHTCSKDSPVVQNHRDNAMLGAVVITVIVLTS